MYSLLLVLSYGGRAHILLHRGNRTIYKITYKYYKDNKIIFFIFFISTTSLL